MAASAERIAVENAIRENFPLFEDAVVDGLTAADVAGWDSFAHVNLMFSIESALDRSVDISETFALKNIGELVKYLESVSR